MEQVALGENGLIRGWKAGDIYVDMSTNSPSTIRLIAVTARGKGVHVLDAPVTGRVPGRGGLAGPAGGQRAAGHGKKSVQAVILELEKAAGVRART